MMYDEMINTNHAHGNARKLKPHESKMLDYAGEQQINNEENEECNYGRFSKIKIHQIMKE